VVVAEPRIPAPPKLDGAEPAHIQIEQWLVRAIGRGELAAGDRLPPEHELAAAIGVSRMTLRQALGRLESRDVIVRTPGRRGGTFVSEPKIECDLSGWAGFTDVMRRAHVRVGARVVSAQTVPAIRLVAEALGLPRGDGVHEVVRVRRAGRRPLALEHSWFPAALFPGLLARPLTGSLYALLRKEYDHDPRAADEFVAPVVAGGAEATLLDVDPGTPLLQVERITSTGSGLPIEYARDLFRPDRIRLRVRSEVAGEDGPGLAAPAPRTRLRRPVRH
jgi:GntR family transcriptional regulator